MRTHHWLGGRTHEAAGGVERLDCDHTTVFVPEHPKPADADAMGRHELGPALPQERTTAVSADLNAPYLAAEQAHKPSSPSKCRASLSEMRCRMSLIFRNPIALQEEDWGSKTLRCLEMGRVGACRICALREVEDLADLCFSLFCVFLSPIWRQKWSTVIEFILAGWTSRYREFNAHSVLRRRWG